ncbi:Putative uncharacterized protein YbcY [Cytospora mali]|uniref:Methyltransferase domain-containing protein n=1 Tax=Cytospora mali TaxID=578113 RepID=A0A194VUK3_CYTMA|nr:Putative uncharacterized protein YbcY [Valsa mali]
MSQTIHIVAKEVDKSDIGSQDMSHLHGAKIYSQRGLELYDPIVHGFMSPYAWRCEAARLSAFFNRNVERANRAAGSARGPRIMDIGCGTGYFLASAPLAKGGEVVLVDLNPNCLDASLPVVTRAHPECADRITTAVGDFLATGDEPLSLFASGSMTGRGGFDGVSTMFLLHCLPGPPRKKAEALCRMGGLLRGPDGVLFGATILGKGTGQNWLARFGLWLNNSKGIFCNYEDDAESFVEVLRENFNCVGWELECERHVNTQFVPEEVLPEFNAGREAS